MESGGIFGGLGCLGLQTPSKSLFSDKHKMIGEEIGFPFCSHLWSPVVTCGPWAVKDLALGVWVLAFWHFVGHLDSDMGPKEVPEVEVQPLTEDPPKRGKSRKLAVAS